MQQKEVRINFRGKAAEDLVKLKESRGHYTAAQTVGAALKTYNTLLDYANKDPCGTNILTVTLVKPQNLLDKIMGREYIAKLPLNLP